MTERCARYEGRRVIIYWHVERGSVCIHARLRRCSSSQVAGMIEGVLRPDTEMEIEWQYADGPGQKRGGFRLLQVTRLPAAVAAEGDRGASTLSAGSRKPAYPHLACAIARPID
jgi:TnpA family transposase